MGEKERGEGGKGLPSIPICGVTTVRMTAATGATSVIWVLDDHARRSHVGNILGGGHRHTVSIGLGPICGHARGRHRINNLLLLGLDVYRHRLRVPVLNGLGV
jgi:hypothetical protein